VWLADTAADAPVLEHSLRPDLTAGEVAAVASGSADMVLWQSRDSQPQLHWRKGARSHRRLCPGPAQALDLTLQSPSATGIPAAPAGDSESESDPLIP
jgi:hypothetical protein